MVIKMKIKEFLLLLLFFLVSCTKQEIPANEISSNLLNTYWYVNTYKDSGGLKNINNYTINFDKLNTINIFTGVNDRSGNWAVYEGYNGPILQIRYPNYNQDSISLNGNWNIITYEVNRIVLKQELTEIILILK